MGGASRESGEQGGKAYCPLNNSWFLVTFAKMRYITNRVKQTIRSVENFPEEGVVFRDISPVLADSDLFRAVMQEIALRWHGSVDSVAAVESRGFILGSAVAFHLGVGLHLLRKPGKLPPPVVREDYDLEYGRDGLEISKDIVRPGSRVLLVDDVLATGGTAEASVKLLRSVGANVVGATFMVDLPKLGGRERLQKLGVEPVSMLDY